MKIQPNQRWAFLGKTGSGKSFRAKATASALQRSGYRVVAFDPHDEYSELGRPSKERTLGPLRARVTVDELLRCPEMLDEGKLSLAVTPGGTPKDVAEDFCELLPIIKSTGNLVLLMDEVGDWGDYAEQELNHVATQSRHWGVPVIFVAQRAVQIPKTARTQLTEIHSGRQDDPEDIQALAKRMGHELADRVSRLGPREFVQWRDSWAGAPVPSKPKLKEHRT